MVCFVNYIYAKNVLSNFCFYFFIAQNEFKRLEKFNFTDSISKYIGKKNS